jgi:hypothetical protein
MSLDSRLRADLQEVARTIEPSTEAALESILQRHDRSARIRRLAPRVVAAVAAVLVVAGVVTWRVSGSHGDDEPPIVKEPRVPAGTYGATLTGDLAGPWRLRFGKTSVSLVAPDAAVLGTRLAAGTYDIRAGAITTDLLADGPCSGPGSYTWRRVDGDLAFTVLDDDCDLRFRLLTGSAWAPAAGGSLATGTYTTPALTVDQLRATALAAGFTPTEVDANLDYEGVRTVTFTLQLKNDNWTEFETRDAQPPTIGWSGPYAVKDSGTVVAGEPPCGPITYDYGVSGDQLSVVVLEDACTGGERIGELIAQTIIYETAPFTRVGD